MKKKVFAAVLAVSMLMMTACGSTQETTISSNSEEETTAEMTTEATAQETEESETTESEEGNDDIIIPLFEAPYESEVRQVSPEQWSTNYEQTYALYFPLISTNRTVGDSTIYQFADSNYQARETFTLSNGASETTDLAVYLCVGSDGNSVISFEGNGASDAIDFVPLFYNQTKQCLAGYSGYSTGNPGFREVYWDDVIGITIPTDVDPANYGF